MKRCLFLVALLLLGSSSAWAAHPGSRGEIENLRERLRALEAELGMEPVVETPFTLRALGRSLTFSGLLELEADYSKTRGAAASSDLTLATVQLSVEAAINPHVGGHVVLLYEEDPEAEDEAVQVDEAVISLTCPRPWLGQTLAVHGGRMYVPFGRFSSFMISDPLTLELGETNATAALLSFAGDLWSLRVAGFNGKIDAGGDPDRIDSLAATLDITPLEGLSLGFSWISDLAESDLVLVNDPVLYATSVAGGAAFLSASYGPYSVEAEILGALDDFDAALIGLSELTGKRPRTWYLELAFSPTETLQLAARYEAARDLRDDVARYGASVSYGLFAQTLVALEYLASDYRNDPDNATLTAQLSFEF